MFLTLQVITVFLASIAMSLAVAHALELPGKMRLNKENYIATPTIYYAGITIGGASAGFFAFGKDKLSAQSANPDEKWMSFRNRWKHSHVFRAVLAVAALISLVVAVAPRGHG